MSSTTDGTSSKRPQDFAELLAGQGPSLEAVRILLASFLAYRDSRDPLRAVELFSPNGDFEWGEVPALQQVIQSTDDLSRILNSPGFYQNALTIIEPWQDVGVNPRGEAVRASKNIAYIAKVVADCNAILLPLWSSGLIDLARIVPLLAASRGVIVEGGRPSVTDLSSGLTPVAPCGISVR